MLKKKMFRDIKQNLSQFITIFLMVLIGIMVYVGIEAYMDGMTSAADNFYKNNNIQDLNVMGNLSDKDLDKIKSLDNVKDDLLEFYQTCVIRIEEIVKRGIVSGVFHNAPKSEDILTMIIGSALFVIRNKNFYEQYVPTNNEAQYQKESEQKLKNSILLSVFAILDYEQD